MATSSSRRLDGVWKYGLLGGLGSVPLTAALSTWTGSVTTLSGNGVVVGAALAGYLAANASREASRAGLIAGVVGGAPFTVWTVGTLLGIPDGTVVVWSNPVPEVALLLSVAFALTLLSTIAGVIGGLVGGWLSGRIHPRRMDSAGN
jgi:uncharacterized membrane protein YeaQ/YmgE (transglycosylase-associated protein family)